MKRWHLLASVVFFAMSVWLPHEGAAAEYYVDQSHPSASDTNSGTESLPWATLYAINSASLAPGDIVYVKNGTYMVTSGGHWTFPAIAPRQAGAPGNPIVIAAYPGHSPVVDGGNVLGNANLGARTNYVTIRGFTLRNVGDWGLMAAGSPSNRITGVVFEWNDVHGVTLPNEDNQAAIYVRYTDGTIVRNNHFHNEPDLRSGGNIAAVFLEVNRNVIVENNDIHDFATGIFDKYGGQSNEFRFNYIHRVSRGIAVSCFQQEINPCSGGRFHHNIIAFSNGSITIAGSTSTWVLPNYEVYSNTLYEVGQGIVAGPSPNLVIYNNAIGAVTSAQAALFYEADSDLTISNYNNFFPRQRVIRDEFGPTQQVWNSLTEWQGTGRDLNSLAVDPQFSGAPGPQVTPETYRLAAGSPLRGAGRVGGVSSGAAVHIGAYDRDTRVIGQMRERDTLAPAAPSGLTVR